MSSEYNISKQKLANRIAGEISLSEDPGETIKKWRDIFEISQRELADMMDVMPSVISDYENGRRESPGIKMVEKIVNSLLSIEDRNNGKVIREFLNVSNDKLPEKAVIDINEFQSPRNVSKFLSDIGAEAVSDHDSSNKVYGYSLINSVKAITDLSSKELVRIYGPTSQRALVFSNITRGRSPMVAIKVTNFKPGLVVLHDIDKSEVDPLALRIAEAENIPLASISDVELDQLKLDLRQILKNKS